jgi:hypothetical protein
MRRYLVVANQTLGGDHLMERLRSCVEAGPCSVHILVPASSDPRAWSHSHEGDYKVAAKRLAEAKERFATLGIEVSGEVGDTRPVDTVLDVLRREEFDEVILSTLPAGMSRWLGMDLVSRVERAVSIPVTHVTAADTPINAS